jgi:hypothetical protein
VILEKAIGVLSNNFIRNKKKYPELGDLATKINTISPDIKNRVIKLYIGRQTLMREVKFLVFLKTTDPENDEVSI